MPLPTPSLAGAILVEGGARYSGRAQEAAPLLQRYAQVRNDAEKAATVEALNGVFQDIRFKHGYKADHGFETSGLVAFFFEGRLLRPPNNVVFACALVLSIDPDGQATVLKSREPLARIKWPALDLFIELGGRIVGRSRWVFIGGDEDWF